MQLSEIGAYFVYRFVLSTLVRSFFYISQWICVSEPNGNISGPIKINVLFLPYLYLSFQGRFVLQIAKFPLDFHVLLWSGVL